MPILTSMEDTQQNIKFLNKIYIWASDLKKATISAFTGQNNILLSFFEQNLSSDL